MKAVASMLLPRCWRWRDRATGSARSPAMRPIAAAPGRRCGRRRSRTTQTRRAAARRLARMRGGGRIQRSQRRRSERNRAAPGCAAGFGPPGSQMQVRSAASRRAGNSRYSLRAMMTATERPARTPSERLTARTLTTFDSRTRSGARDRKAGGMRGYCRFPWKKSRNNVFDAVCRMPPMISGR
jgi:hypothetical protein